MKSWIWLIVLGAIGMFYVADQRSEHRQEREREQAVYAEQRTEWKKRLDQGPMVTSQRPFGEGLELIEYRVPSRMFDGDPEFDIECRVLRDVRSGNLSDHVCTDGYGATGSYDEY